MFANFTGKHLFGLFFNKDAGPQNSNSGVFMGNLRNLQEHLILQNICNTASDSFRFSVCNFIKSDTPTKTNSVNLSKFLRASFYRTPPDYWFFYLSVNFEKFVRTSLLKRVIPYTSCKISTTRYSKKVFHRCFLSILYKNDKKPFEDVHALKIPGNKQSWEKITRLF